ncbi:GntR family transcriptional regulator [Nocardioides baekrokdamisoli]|uniref:GntR family transcriptional regulator n=1 Tax=Nocardioides baekrokdamisoli TaxID=1804624 RepID=A0A3G9J4J3_9ACTN|nr:GntR family transcriptional regulator [Nocardioides baekrokdamisoli]BBH18344.1 GntR family transcriptional regulator [Nocardioides baekrokdamisoli]
MRFVIDPASSVPAYEQIVRQVVDGAANGTLQAGEKLPTVRALAAELGLAVNTVAKAYRELEMRGAIETRGRAGTFVTGETRDRDAAVAAHEYVRKARALGLSETEMLAQVRHALGITSAP